MTTVLTLVGSLRAGSYNAGLAAALPELAPDGIQVVAGPSLDLPLYNADLDTDESRPASVVALADAVAAAEALVLVSPEYNHGISGVLKNAIDWLSRGRKVIRGHTVAIAGATPGAFGTTRAQIQLRTTLSCLGIHALPAPDVAVMHAENKFADGTPPRLADDDTRQRLASMLSRLGDLQAALTDGD